MRGTLAVLAIALLGGCGGWDYKATPIDGNGDKHAQVQCFVIERAEHGFLFTRTFALGRYCKVSDE